MMVIELASHYILVALVLRIESCNVANIGLAHVGRCVWLLLCPVIVSRGDQVAFLGSETSCDELGHRLVHRVRATDDQLGVLTGHHVRELWARQAVLHQALFVRECVIEWRYVIQFFIVWTCILAEVRTTEIQRCSPPARFVLGDTSSLTIQVKQLVNEIFGVAITSTSVSLKTVSKALRRVRWQRIPLSARGVNVGRLRQLDSFVESIFKDSHVLLELIPRLHVDRVFDKLLASSFQVVI